MRKGDSFLDKRVHTTYSSLTYSQKWVDVKGIPAMRFIPSKKALWTNYTDALGYCSSQVPKINFDECAVPTNDPDILDLNNCGIKDEEGRSVCNPDGIRDDA